MIASGRSALLLTTYRVRIRLESCNSGRIGVCCAIEPGRSLDGIGGVGSVAPWEVHIAIGAFLARWVGGSVALQGGEGVGELVEAAVQSRYEGGIQKIGGQGSVGWLVGQVAA